MLEDGPDPRVESVVVAGLGIEHREVLVDPLPDILTCDDEPRRCRTAEILGGHRCAERYLAQLEEVRWIDEVIGSGERDCTTRGVDRLRLGDPAGLLQRVIVIASRPA